MHGCVESVRKTVLKHLGKLSVGELRLDPAYLLLHSLRREQTLRDRRTLSRDRPPGHRYGRIILLKQTSHRISTALTATEASWPTQRAKATVFSSFSSYKVRNPCTHSVSTYRF